MLTRFYFLGFLALCLGVVQTYTILDSLGNQESCPAIARRREYISPEHRAHYNIQHHESQEQPVCRKPESQFKPVQWLMRIIHISGIMVKQPTEKPRVAPRDLLLHRRRALQNPMNTQRQGKMLLILKHKPEPRHLFM